MQKINENAFENVVYNVAAILFMKRWVKYVGKIISMPADGVTLIVLGHLQDSTDQK